MKNKLKSWLSVIAITGVMGVPLLIPSAPVLPVDASLTAPASYDYGYIWNSSGSHQYYVSANGASPTSIALFTRTADGVYYNYSHTFSNSGSHSNTANYDLPEGLDITMTFNRSNTSWTDSSPTYTGYYPTENKIGADNTVGTVTKIDLTFDNQTSKDYKLMLDYSSSGATVFLTYSFNGENYGTSISYAHTSLINFIIPAYSVFNIFRTTSSTFYFDAWYLKDLGVSESYTQGNDAGYDTGYDFGYDDGLSNNPNVLITGFESLIGMFVNFVFIIFSLEIFGVSILSIAGILFGIVAVVWILKTIRG